METRWVKSWHDRVAPLGSMTETESAKFYETLHTYAAKDQAAGESGAQSIVSPGEQKV